MNSIENGATIRIGFEEKTIIDFEEEKPLKYNIPVYSLKINKKTLYVSRGNNFGLREIQDIAKIMKINNTKKYVIYNGETLDENNKWESCLPQPHSHIEFFKKNLDHFLY